MTFQTLMGQYAVGLAPAVKYLGGSYINRDHHGDPNARMPFVNIPLAEQHKALDFIVERAFAPDAFEFPPELLTQLGANRWSHWGNSNTFRGRIDYPLHEIVLGIQTSMLNNLTTSSRLARIRDAELKFGTDSVIGIPELMLELTQAIWSEVWTSPGQNVNAMRRDLQRAYVDRMTTILEDPPARMPADARAVIRHRLTDLQQRVNRRLAPPRSFDDYTLAHLQDVSARIEKALQAAYTVELN